MNRVEEIENAVRELAPDDLAAFREWFEQFDADAWDRQIEADVHAGKLDLLAERALEAHRKGQTSPL